jgi:hypothetical protein
MPNQPTYQPMLISGSLTGVSQTSTAVNFYGLFSVFLGGTFSATILLERSPDNGLTYYPCSTDATGTIAAFAAPMSVDVIAAQFGVLYRLRCTAYTSGAATYALLQGTNTVGA